MRILHVTFSEKGGAAIGVRRLDKALKHKNIKSKIFFYDKYIEKKKLGVFFLSYKLLWKLKVYLRKILLKVATSGLSKETSSFNWLNNLNLNKINEFKQSDIVHLHWVGNEMISIKEIASISKPIVWTLHDMWPFCGTEHFAYKERYIKKYKNSSKNTREKGLDFDKYIWKLKKKHLGKKKINFISPSKWMEKKFVKSNTFNNYKIITLPYIINTNNWKPKKKITKNKKIVLLFSATSSVNYRKGFYYLSEAINNHINKDKFILYVVGDKPKLFDKIQIEKKYFGIIKSETTLQGIYLSSDIFVLPSLIESFGQVYLEAGLLGMPCICFKNTAAAEIINHKKTGYSAKFKSSEDLASGIHWCAEKLLKEKMRKKIRNIVLEKYSANKIISKYINYYNDIRSH